MRPSRSLHVTRTPAGGRGLAALLTTLALVLAACGSDGGGRADDPTTTTDGTAATTPADCIPAETGETAETTATTATTTTGACADASTTTTTAAPADPTPEEIETMSDEELAEEAYVAGYPVVVSIRTLQRLRGLGTNTLFWQTTLAGPESRVIVAPNRDTLYSIAVLDLRSEPLVLTLPEVTDRYYTYQLLSPWTDSFAYIGTRATGGRAGSWVIAPPGWEGEAPEGAEVIESPTNQVFLLGRFLVDDEADVANVIAIRDRSSLQPLSAVTGAEPGPPLAPLAEAAGTAQAIPTDAAFFDELVPSLAANPPPTDAQRALFAALEERMADGEGDDARRAALDAGAAAGADRIAAEVASRTELVGGWSVNRDIGVYGDDVALRAFVARIGWGANVPEEAVYPVAQVDADGAPLDGSRDYTITFPADRLPPLDDLGFWSLSAYGPDMFFAPHPSNRYTVGDRTPGLVRGEDGSLTIHLSHDEPSAADGGTANWLPVPAGRFVLMLRLYLPAEPILDGTWTPPPAVPSP
ncbi:DUF1254 domain-containing protein [Iamia sp. SCSIO 61187]|uniref:DUF1254 domain-containing protein n=1 Tax=Iamia sp. SCSIO 61187 TaxID=2722752 RepID=UPI001C627841|nr:DUF1254 domain-containing protein [Iamia sp. SCSIO 61187]QYG95163.1 DUF1254 domain-containing protein [Iamia sp. SCSIO 61187]